MSDELDINKLVVGFVQANIDRLADAVGSAFKGARNMARSKLRKTYEEYLKRLLEQHSKSKSFFIRSEPMPLYKFFVPLDLSTEQRTLKRAGMKDIIKVSPLSVITGSGGCGKTMLMRHLLIDSLKEGTKIPVFIELRQLNQNSSGLREVTIDSVQRQGLNVDDRYLELALNAGHFCMLLDGFDELILKLHKPIADQIHQLAEMYPKNWIIVSSRPDTELNTLRNFVQFRIDPLDLDAAIALVDKLPFDDPIKDKFVDDLRDSLFKKHESFLSNPLLLSIMLLTYTDIAHIPSKLSLFYGQAYESLFQKHDALKGGFQRERRTNLDIQDFARAFSAFCILSYDKRDFKFSRTSALDYFSKGKLLCQLDYDTSDLLDDSLQAVCLLLEDGLDIAFAHRSFQEYFVARFISRCEPRTKKKLIKRYADNVGADSVMELLYEMAPVDVETYYVLPTIQKIKNMIGFRGTLGITHYLAFIRRFYERFNLVERPEGRISATIGDAEIFVAYIFFSRHFQANFATAATSEDTERAWMQRATELFIKEGGGKKEIPTSGLTTRSPFLRHMAQGSSMWGFQFLKAIIEIEKVIKRQHKQIKASLEELLD